MRLVYVPKRIGSFGPDGFRVRNVARVESHGPVETAVHPGTPIKGSCTLVTIHTEGGNPRHYGFNKAWIDGSLQMVCELLPGQEKDEVIAAWETVPEVPPSPKNLPITYTKDATLLDLIRDAYESVSSPDVPVEERAERVLPRSELKITPRLRYVWNQFENSLESVLALYADDEWANERMEQDNAAYVIFMTMIGSGVGIQDGRWDHVDIDDYEAFSDHVCTALQPYADITGGGLIPEALIEACYRSEGS